MSASTTPARPRPIDSRRPTHRGFTFVELIVAVGISSVLLIALSSVVLLASRSIPSSASAVGRVFDATMVMGDLRTELLSAERILELTDRSIAFTVPDRDLDGWPEQIRYEWSGTPGDPLRWSTGGGTPVDVLADVRGFHLAPDRVVRTERYPGPMSNDDGEQMVLDTFVGDTIPRALVESHYQAQILAPRLDADVVAWQPTRVQFRLSRKAIAVDSITAQLRDVVGGEPGRSVLASDIVGAGVVLDAEDWWTFVFPSGPRLRWDEEAAIVLRGDQSDEANASRVLWVPDPSVTGVVDSWGGDTSWMRYGGQALACRLFARQYRSSGVRTLHRVAAAALSVRIDREGSAPVETRIELPGRPEVVRNRWTHDPIAGDPLVRDDDGDGVGDWTDRGGQTVDGAIAADLDTPVVVEFVGRSSTNNCGVSVRIDANNDAAGSTPVVMEFMYTDSAQQTIWVKAARSGVLETVVAVSGIPATESVSVRLVVDPIAGGVHVVIAGQDHGTLPLQRLNDPPPARGVSLTLLGVSPMDQAATTIIVPEPLP